LLLDRRDVKPQLDVLWGQSVEVTQELVSRARERLRGAILSP